MPILIVFVYNSNSYVSVGTAPVSRVFGVTVKPVVLAESSKNSKTVAIYLYTQL